MKLLVRCKKCGAKFEAQASLAGKKGKCPKCGGPITVPSRASSDQDQHTVQLQKGISQEIRQQPTEGGQHSSCTYIVKNSTVTSKCFFWIFGLILCCLVSGLLFYRKEPSWDEQVQARVEKVEKDFLAHHERLQAPNRAAYDMAVDAVLKKLKTPGTAKFPPSRSKDADSHSLSISLPTGSYYVVKSWVDSQDSFGALTRKRFYVRLRQKDGGAKLGDKFSDKWEIYEIEFEEWAPANQ